MCYNRGRWVFSTNRGGRMSPFTKDTKWMEAKKVINGMDWVLIVSYYRFVGGKNIFVYVIGDQDRKLIVDITGDDDDVILINKKGELEVDTYENVTNSRKEFTHSEEYKEQTYYVKGEEITVPIEC